MSARQAANNQTLPVAHRPDTPFGGLEGLPLHGKQAAQDLAECLSLFRCFTPACWVARRSSAARRRLLAITTCDCFAFEQADGNRSADGASWAFPPNPNLRTVRSLRMAGTVAIRNGGGRVIERVDSRRRRESLRQPPQSTGQSGPKCLGLEVAKRKRTQTLAP